MIGLGYVGLPLLVEFARAGFRATGFDVDTSKIDQITRGESYIPDVPAESLRACIASGRLHATTDLSLLPELDTVNICVPTPLRKTKDPDLSYIVAACRGHRQAPQTRSTRDSRVDDVIQARPKRLCSRHSKLVD